MTEGQGTMRDMSRQIVDSFFRIAYANGQRRLVPGAFGCGAFRQHSTQVVMLFRQVMNEDEFRGIFREIHFAIIEDSNSVNRNYTTFKQVFDRLMDIV